MDNLNHTCYILSRNSNRCDVCGAPLPNSLGATSSNSKFDKEDIIIALKDIRRLFNNGKSRTADNALRIHENYIKVLDRAIEIVNEYYERGEV